MLHMKSTGMTANRNGEIQTSAWGVTESNIFPSSQFFPAKDGTWLMVDWMTTGVWYWYVTEGVM